MLYYMKKKKKKKHEAVCTLNDGISRAIHEAHKKTDSGL